MVVMMATSIAPRLAASSDVSRFPPLVRRGIGAVARTAARAVLVSGWDCFCGPPNCRPSPLITMATSSPSGDG